MDRNLQALVHTCDSRSAVYPELLLYNNVNITLRTLGKRYWRPISGEKDYRFLDSCFLAQCCDIIEKIKIEVRSELLDKVTKVLKSKNVFCDMDEGNQSTVVLTEFVLTGFSKSLQTRIMLFILFLLFYILAIFGNSLLIFTVVVSPRIHTPMYYFLGHLSFIDLCYSSNSLPKMLHDVFSEKRRISVIGCLTQMNIGLFLGGIECMLLAVMAYDRYIAICFPLRYTVIMSWRLCHCVTFIMWVVSFILTTVPNMARPLVFCNENRINHFACEILVLVALACGDLSFYKIVSYICIIVSILSIRSRDGKSKAFSTCASHLIVVLMVYGTSITMYMGNTKGFSSNLKYISLIYGVVTPVLNPMIYSLRNSELLKSSLAAGVFHSFKCLL
ncbi:olfactory receptor 2A7-like [Engystomops pustulosus]|uniref:olfactory receptor 2A7-like n=1 Tax=Engystomops pustulosus TaxID=76066 RepID=UPI003AFB6D62